MNQAQFYMAHNPGIWKRMDVKHKMEWKGTQCDDSTKKGIQGPLRKETSDVYIF